MFCQIFVVQLTNQLSLELSPRALSPTLAAISRRHWRRSMENPTRHGKGAAVIEECGIPVSMIQHGFLNNQFQTQ